MNAEIILIKQFVISLCELLCSVQYRLRICPLPHLHPQGPEQTRCDKGCAHHNAAAPNAQSLQKAACDSQSAQEQRRHQQIGRPGIPNQFNLLGHTVCHGNVVRRKKQAEYRQHKHDRCKDQEDHILAHTGKPAPSFVLNLFHWHFPSSDNCF
ncbi:MAG TPA: hypothetical protein IAC19_06290 [Candidatus Ventricola gallistercoris]|nr:hypothetical protein [Candidatus Ventricola gallistercoris]